MKILVPVVVAVNPPSAVVTVIVKDEDAEIPVTNPVALTVAIVGSLDAYVTAKLEAVEGITVGTS